MFAELLQRELHATTPELVPVLHERAAAWFAANGLAEEAIEHAIAAGGGERAAALLYDNWQQLFAQRRFVTLRGTIARLPDDRGELTGFCEILDTLCLAHEGGDHRLLAQRLDALERYRGQPGVEPLIDQMRVGPYYGDVGRAVKDGWAAWQRYPDLRIRAELSGQFGSGAVVRRRPRPCARHRRTAPGRDPAARRTPLGARSAGAHRPDDGDPDLAERCGRQAVEVATLDGDGSALECHVAYTALGEALRLQGRLDEAAEQQAHAARLTGRQPSTILHAFTLVFEAQLALTRRDRDRARAAAARAIVDRYSDVGTLSDRLGATSRQHAVTVSRERGLL